MYRMEWSNGVYILFSFYPIFIEKNSPLFLTYNVKKASNFFNRIPLQITILFLIKLALFYTSQIAPFLCALINCVNDNAPLNPYLFHFQAEDRQQNLTYFMRADGTREGKLFRSPHTNNQYKFRIFVTKFCLLTMLVLAR